MAKEVKYIRRESKTVKEGKYIRWKNKTTKGKVFQVGK